ncbi:hypothetical protein ACIBSW_35320 [Actinoplanes sp. NPDC049668]|uniref:hypothetical protein n=1 Tax=unclassified Actinoplanes TaxID=2626549 RepID=UPI00339FE1E0
MTETPPVAPRRPGVRPSRPPVVTAGLLLMLPAAVIWLVAGIAWVVVSARMEGGAFWVWMLAVPVVALCLLVSLICFAGIRLGWRGRPHGLHVPGGFTMALFVIVIINLLVRGRIEYSPTQLTPLIVGTLAGVAVGLLRSRQSKQWFRACAAYDGRPPPPPRRF